MSIAGIVLGMAMLVAWLFMQSAGNGSWAFGISVFLLMTACSVLVDSVRDIVQMKRADAGEK
jgi:hypothetical protein